MTAPALSMLISDRLQEDLLQELTQEIALVEEELNLQVQSQVRSIADVAKHTLRAGGKRLRPAFVAIGAKATGLQYDHRRTQRVGASLEMIHMATLIHDDVIDNSATRRGRPTAAAVYGNRASILSGDALLAKATVLLTQDGDPDLIRVVCEAVVDMAEGEVREVETRGSFDLAEADHLEILRMKTASFIEACCESGAIVAGAGADTRRALRDYGRHVGLAFQIVDDILDYRGDRAKTGKPLATDFREGQATLPLIYLRDQLSKSEEALVRSKFGETVTDDEIRMISAWMESRGVFARCQSRAEEYVSVALSAVKELPEETSREFLGTVAEYVLKRQL